MDFELSLLYWFIARRICYIQLLKYDSFITRSHDKKLSDLELRNQFDSLSFIKEEANLEIQSSKVVNLSNRVLSKLEINVFEKG